MNHAPSHRRYRRAPAVAALTAMLAVLISVPSATADVSRGDSPPAADWEWPVGDAASPPRVARGFEEPESVWGPGHRGADLVVDRGVEVRSPAAGTVAFVGVVVDRPVLSIDHGNGLRTSLEPVRAHAQVGDAVSGGEIVGTVAAGGHCGAGCLHWGLRLDGVYIDPLPTVRDLRPSILWPLPDG
ncbi:murein hydrolase activator EnvC family protein [Zhihengliuella halotolerans]|nr:M23 family metallopeptidase [Zhihengliuella halotolerans]